MGKGPPPPSRGGGGGDRLIETKLKSHHHQGSLRPCLPSRAVESVLERPSRGGGFGRRPAPGQPFLNFCGGGHYVMVCAGLVGGALLTIGGWGTPIPPPLGGANTQGFCAR